MNQNKQYRKHRYEDYEPEVDICHDKVKISSKYNLDDNDVGYISRYDTIRFRFESKLGNKILNYKDWNVEYLK